MDMTKTFCDTSGFYENRKGENCLIKEYGEIIKTVKAITKL